MFADDSVYIQFFEFMQRLSRRVKRRTRTKRRHIMQSTELCEYFGVDLSELEAVLRAKGLPYHKDSNLQIWASIEIRPDTL